MDLCNQLMFLLVEFTILFYVEKEILIDVVICFFFVIICFIKCTSKQNVLKVDFLSVNTRKLNN